VTIDPLARFRLDGRVAVVTGASSGLGARFARVLDAAGARVVVAARRGDRLGALAAELTDALPVAIDLTEAGAPQRLVDATVERYGRLDVLVNNAGTAKPAPALDQPIEDFRQVVEINLVVPFDLARCAARVMIGYGGGSIVNIASVWALGGIAQIPNASYAASKAGIANLTRQLAAEWGRTGVRVNALLPGWFRTEMTEGSMFGDEKGEAFIARETLLRRGGDEHELDGALLLLASDASSYMTGALVSVDGGESAH
jgi:NAD(P)-dependent dehydrogenase (short-subunit alcohol dehydrogenase family)